MPDTNNNQILAQADALIARADRMVQQFAAETEYSKPFARQFAGLRVMVENPAGTTRRGLNRDGTEWATQMHNDYGFIARTSGADGEGIDVYVGPNEQAGNAYIVHQNDPWTGVYDEDKVMVGFDSPELAAVAYQAHYDRPDFYRSMTIIPMATFRDLLKKGSGGVKWKRKAKAASSALFSAADEDGGHWVTIGAQEESDPESGKSERHGGAPVYIGKSGKIEKGPDALVGHSPDDLPSKRQGGEQPDKFADVEAYPTPADGGWRGEIETQMQAWRARVLAERPSSQGKFEPEAAADQPKAKPWDTAGRNIGPYADSLRGMSDRELNKEDRRVSIAINEWARRTPSFLPDGSLNPSLVQDDHPGKQEYWQLSAQLSAIGKEQDRRKGVIRTTKAEVDAAAKPPAEHTALAQAAAKAGHTLPPEVAQAHGVADNPAAEAPRPTLNPAKAKPQPSPEEQARNKWILDRSRQIKANEPSLPREKAIGRAANEWKAQQQATAGQPTTTAKQWDGREPYEFSREEYRQRIIDENGGTPPSILGDMMAPRSGIHRGSVEQAIKAGKIKSHPDYPELSQPEVPADAQAAVAEARQLVAQEKPKADPAADAAAIEMYEDAIKQKKRSGQPVPQDWVDKLAKLKAAQPAPAAPAERPAPAPKPVAEPEKPAAPAGRTVNVKKIADRSTAKAEDLAAHYKSQGLDRHRAWDQFVTDRGLKPEIDAKTFYNLFDGGGRKSLDRVESVAFNPTHIDTLTGEQVQIEKTQHGHKMVRESGSTGHDPGELSDRYKPISGAPDADAQAAVEEAKQLVGKAKAEQPAESYMEMNRRLAEERTAKQSEYPPEIKNLLPYMKYEGGRFLTGEIIRMPKAEKDAVDKWLVSTGHPIGMQPGTQADRIKMVLQEAAEKQPPASPPASPPADLADARATVDAAKATLGGGGEAKAKAAEQPAKPKEPWQMTQEEHLATIDRNRARPGIDYKGQQFTRPPMTPEQRESAAREHRRMVKDRLSQTHDKDGNRIGAEETVPDHVLAGYPEMAEKYGPKKQPAPAAPPEPSATDLLDRMAENNERMAENVGKAAEQPKAKKLGQMSREEIEAEIKEISAGMDSVNEALRRGEPVPPQAGYQQQAERLRSLQQQLERTGRPSPQADPAKQAYFEKLEGHSRQDLLKALRRAGISAHRMKSDDDLKNVLWEKLGKKSSGYRVDSDQQQPPDSDGPAPSGATPQPKAPAGPGGEAKAVYEMSREEYAKRSAAIPASGGFAARANSKIAKAHHRYAVQQAINAGKIDSHPDYPEMKKEIPADSSGQSSVGEPSAVPDLQSRLDAHAGRHYDTWTTRGIAKALGVGEPEVQRMAERGELEAAGTNMWRVGQNPQQEPATAKGDVPERPAPVSVPAIPAAKPAQGPAIEPDVARGENAALWPGMMPELRERDKVESWAKRLAEHMPDSTERERIATARAMFESARHKASEKEIADMNDGDATMLADRILDAGGLKDDVYDDAELSNLAHEMHNHHHGTQFTREVPEERPPVGPGPAHPKYVQPVPSWAQERPQPVSVPGIDEIAPARPMQRSTPVPDPARSRRIAKANKREAEVKDKFGTYLESIGAKSDGYSWKLNTPIGELEIHPMGTWVATRWSDPETARKLIGDDVSATGKWNHHYHERATPEDMLGQFKANLGYAMDRAADKHAAKQQAPDAPKYGSDAMPKPLADGAKDRRREILKARVARGDTQGIEQAMKEFDGEDWTKSPLPTDGPAPSPAVPEPPAPKGRTSPSNAPQRPEGGTTPDYEERPESGKSSDTYIGAAALRAKGISDIGQRGEFLQGTVRAIGRDIGGLLMRRDAAVTTNSRYVYFGVKPDATFHLGFDPVLSVRISDHPAGHDATGTPSVRVRMNGSVSQIASDLRVVRDAIKKASSGQAGLGLPESRAESTGSEVLPPDETAQGAQTERPERFPLGLRQQ